MAVVSQTNLGGPTYEELLAKKRAEGAIGGTAEVRPDTPRTLGTPGLGDPGHVNPAINPAPIWTKQRRPEPVPVINDPGVMGTAPSLQALNRSAVNSDRAASGADPLPEGKALDANVVTQDTIREAAVSRLERINEEAETAASDAEESVRADMPRTEHRASKRGAKSGRAATKVARKGVSTKR
jgi:hypothetical protein